MQVVEFNVNVLKEGVYTIELRENKPSDYYTSLWSETYEDEYVSGFGMLSMKTPRFKVDILPFVEDLPVEGVDRGGSANGIYMAIVLVFMVFGFLVAMLSRRYFAKKKMEK